MAVIGVGHLGKIHAQLLAQVAGTQLVAVVDPIAEARAAAAQSLGVPAHPDHAALLDQIDAAIVAVPTRYHHDVAEEQGVVLQVGHVERFNPAFAAAAPHLREPKYIEAARTGAYSCRSTDIGVVLDLMIHDIDATLALVDDEVVAVEALGAAVFGPNEDWAQARVTFAGGCVANLSASRVAWQAQRSMQVICRDCTAQIDFGAKTAKLMQPSSAVLAGEIDVNQMSPEERSRVKAHLFTDYLTLTDLPVVETNALLEEQREFAAAIRGERVVRVTGEAGRRALDVAERILTSIAAHRWDGTTEGAIGPRFEPREPLLRGPHWHQSRQGVRRRAG
jgi:predicted dehydrogenase